MTIEDTTEAPSFAGIMAQTIDVLMRVGRELSGPAPNLRALQEMTVSCAQVLVAVRIGVAKLERATACPVLAPPPNAILTAPSTIVDLGAIRAARADGAVRP